jgi:flagellar FliL protein
MASSSVSPWVNAFPFSFKQRGERLSELFLSLSLASVYNIRHRFFTLNEAPISIMAASDQNAGNGKKFSIKLLAIILGAVLLAGGIGAGGFYYLQHSANTENTVQNEENDAEKFYYEMGKPLTVNFPKGSSVQLAQIALAFRVAGEETLEALKKHEPMIRNNLLMLISAQQAENLITREEKEKLRAAMLNEVTSVLKKMAGKSQVKELFFTSFVMQ